MKILTDFDGTLTCIYREYEAQKEAFIEKLATVRPIEQIKTIFDNAYKHIQENPTQFGWLNNARISAYADEDLFAMLQSIASCLNFWAKTNTHELHDILNEIKEREHKNELDYADIAYNAHEEMITRIPADKFSIDPTVIPVIQELLERDYEIVVVSNSAPKRIMDKLEACGLKPVWHNDNPSAAFRVRGLCRKFVLGNDPQYKNIHGRKVDINRPFYQAIIEEERPTAILGDVFSLDLALPLHMALQNPNIYEDLQLYLRKQPYTPQWTLELMDQQSNIPQLKILDHFSDLNKKLVER